MSNLRTYITPAGYQTLMTEGFTNSIVYYKINDNLHNYNVKSTQEQFPMITGSHEQITLQSCSYAGYQGVFANEPSKTEIESVISRVMYSLIKEECSYQFNKTNLDVTINLNTWFNQLLNINTYDFNSPGLSITIWDYVTATLQRLDLTTQNYSDVKYITNLNNNFTFKTEKDFGYYELFSPRYVNVTNDSKLMVDKTNIRFASPFFFYFSTNSVNGQYVNNMNGTFGLYPNEIGYWVNNNEFVNVTTVESTPEQFNTIYPAARVGSNYYYLNNYREYPTSSGFIGYALNMTNVNGNGESLLTGLVNQAKLFMKTYGVYDNNNNTYSIPIQMNLVSSNREINNIQNRMGGEIKINFIFNPNDITSSLINVS
jgi:hypothetical protein